MSSPLFFIFQKKSYMQLTIIRHYDNIVNCIDINKVPSFL